MNLYDIHAHMDYPPLDEKLDAVLKRAKDAGVKAIISNGTQPSSNRTVLDMAAKHDIIKPALGFYPTHVHEHDDPESAVEEEIAFIRKQKPMALGEVGLDKKWSEEDAPRADQLFKRQLIGFEKFVHLAEKKSIPLIIHSRKAELEVIEMMESSSAKKIIMHCFSGKKRLVKRVQDNGWSFSIPVIVTKLQQFQEMVQTTPLANLFTETDAPFLGPQPGLTNEPHNVAMTVKKIAELRGLTEQETADQLFMNYQRFFL